MDTLRERLYTLLRWSERYTRTDMVYIARSGFWGNLGSFGVSLFSFLLYVAFAHFLSKEAYGTYQYLLSLAAILGAFTLTGMNYAVTQAVARGNEGALRASVRFQLLWGILPMLGAWVFALYYLLHGNMALGIGLLLIGAGTPAINAFNTYGAFLGGKKDFRRGFWFNFYTNLPYYAALIAVAYVWGSPLALLIANLLSQIIAYFIAYRATLKVYEPNDKEDPETIRYGMHLSAMNLLGTIAGQMDSVLAFHYLGAANLALYSFATALPERLGSFLKFLPTAALPKFAVKTHEEIMTSLLRKSLLAAIAGAVMALVYVIFAKLFFAIFFPAYAAAVPYSQIYALVIIVPVGNIFATALIAQQRVKHLYILNSVMPVLQTALQFVGVIYLGLWGLIFAKLLSWSISGIGSFFLFAFGAPATTQEATEE